MSEHHGAYVIRMCMPGIVLVNVMEVGTQLLPDWVDIQLVVTTAVVVGGVVVTELVDVI